MIEAELQPRIGVYAWAREAAAGRFVDLSWVDATIRDDGRPFLVTTAPDEPEPRFRHVPYGIFLPPAMVSSAREAQEAGEPTALEGLMLVFARPEWLVHARRLLWTPLSPAPAMLVPLVEAYGVDAELHRGDIDRLVRLLAQLPHYHRERGQWSAALHLLTAALDEVPEVTAHASRPESELFACHSARRLREDGRLSSGLRIENGFLRAHVQASPTVRPDELLLSASRAPTFPHALLRLLPAWSRVRLPSLGES